MRVLRRVSIGDTSIDDETNTTKKKKKKKYKEFLRDHTIATTNKKGYSKCIINMYLIIVRKSGKREHLK
jgi:hypothetical protein